jgi:3-methyl-2-oxobutanoate hydroxymethyltransferase
MYANTQVVTAARRKITAPELSQRKSAVHQHAAAGRHLCELGAEGAAAGAARITMVTAYDFTMARLVDEADIDMVLVGDSLGMIVQGHANTLPVTLDEMIYHCRGVARALTRAHLVGDMPFMSYQSSALQALETAGRLMKEGACESVKLEGGLAVAESVAKIVSAGIPVVGHVGLTPQSVHALGGFRVQGRGDAAAKRVVDDARALEQAGAFCIVLEAVPPDVAAEITQTLSIPTIGIGAGPDCDGQVLVCTDLLGLSRGHRPKFVKRYAELGDAAVDAMRAFAAEVHSGSFPAADFTYKPNGVAAPAPVASAPQLRVARAR